jgi:hypothetical protein
MQYTTTGLEPRPGLRSSCRPRRGATQLAVAARTVKCRAGHAQPVGRRSSDIDINEVIRNSEDSARCYATAPARAASSLEDAPQSATRSVRAHHDDGGEERGALILDCRGTRVGASTRWNGSPPGLRLPDRQKIADRARGARSRSRSSQADKRARLRRRLVVRVDRRSGSLLGVFAAPRAVSAEARRVVATARRPVHAVALPRHESAGHGRLVYGDEHHGRGRFMSDGKSLEHHVGVAQDELLTP